MQSIISVTFADVRALIAKALRCEPGAVSWSGAEIAPDGEASCMIATVSRPLKARGRRSKTDADASTAGTRYQGGRRKRQPKADAAPTDTAAQAGE